MVARRAHNPEVAGSSPVSATNKSHAFAWLFSFACFVAGPSPAVSPRGFFFSGGRKIARRKNTHFFMAGERGNTSTKTGRTKTNDTMLIIKRPISSALVFLHTGPERGTCFFRGLSAAAFSSLLVFSQQCFPGVFHFPLFFCRDLRGGQSGARTPCQQSLLWEYHHPLPALGRPQKQVEK